MKKTCTILAIIFLVSVPLMAESVIPAVRSGAKSLDFTFGGLGTFGIGPAGVNSGLSATYFLKKEMAVRAGVQIK